MSPLRRWWRQRVRAVVGAVGPLLASAALRLIGWTVRVRLENADALFRHWAQGEQVILAFWHNRAAMMPLQYRGAKICIMNSQHRDGQLASRALARWGIRSVGGSATRGGVGGLLGLIDAFRHGYDLAVVPDGPRGPLYRVKPGVVHLAKLTGAPIFPVSYDATRRVRLRSWDRFIVPLPLARVVYVVGDPLRVSRDAGDAQLAALRDELEARLSRITAAAEAAVGQGGAVTEGATHG